MRTNLIFLLVVSIFSLILLEVLVRVFIFNPNQFYIKTPGWTMEVRTNDLLRNVSGDHVVITNKYGYRGAEPQIGAKPFVAVIGGSTVEDWVLSDSETWVKQLEFNLRKDYSNIYVANLGKGGTNARHNLMQLEATHDNFPEVDIYIVLMGLNDFLFDLRIHHPFELPENWWQNQAFMSKPGDEGKFATIAIIKRIFKVLLNESYSPVAVSKFGDYQKSLRDAYHNVTDEQWVDTLPDISIHLEKYKKTILDLKQFAEKRKKKIYFITQPFLWSSNMSKESLNMIYAGFIGSDMLDPSTKWYTNRAMEEGLTAYNYTLLNVCRDVVLNCIDLASLLPREAKYFYDDFHFSEVGAAEIGRIVSEKLIESGGLNN